MDILIPLHGQEWLLLRLPKKKRLKKQWSHTDTGEDLSLWRQFIQYSELSRQSYGLECIQIQNVLSVSLWVETLHKVSQKCVKK